jgi:predicted nucleotidyltransferase
MVSVQQKIVDEILEEYRNKKGVIGICVFGSVSVGKEREKSDVDITIIYDDDREWELFKENRYGIVIDFEVVTSNIWEMMLREYPYLFYIENHKILFDKTGFVKEIVEKNKNYFNRNLEIYNFWKQEYELMRELKARGEKPKNFIAICDEAEIKFSNNQSVKRTILTSEFFQKHMRK